MEQTLAWFAGKEAREPPQNERRNELGAYPHADHAREKQHREEDADRPRRSLVRTLHGRRDADVAASVPIGVSRFAPRRVPLEPLGALAHARGFAAEACCGLAKAAGPRSPARRPVIEVLRAPL